MADDYYCLAVNTILNEVPAYRCPLCNTGPTSRWCVRSPALLGGMLADVLAFRGTLAALADHLNAACALPGQRVTFPVSSHHGEDEFRPRIWIAVFYPVPEARIGRNWQDTVLWETTGEPTVYYGHAKPCIQPGATYRSATPGEVAEMNVADFVRLAELCSLF